MSAMRRLDPLGQLRGRGRGPAAIACAASASASSSTQRHTRPTRSASPPSSTSPNSTAAARRPAAPAMRRSIHVWPPPGWSPSWRKRVSNLALVARPAAASHDQRQVHAGADGGAVDGGEGRQRAAGDPEEALVDAAQARLAATRPRCERSAPAQNAGGAPVTTTAPTPSSASSSSKASTISSTIVEGQRVAPVGVVERDDGDPVGDLDRTRLTSGPSGWSRTTAGEWRKKCSTSSS